MGHEDYSDRRERCPCHAQDYGTHSFVLIFAWFIRCLSCPTFRRTLENRVLEASRRPIASALAPLHSRDSALPKIDRTVDQEAPIPAPGPRNIAGLQGLTESVIHLSVLLTIDVMFFTCRRSCASSRPQSPLFKKPLKRILLDYSKTPTSLACTQKG